jgi:hypothetical protein
LRDKFAKKSDTSSEQGTDHTERSVSLRQAESEVWDIEKGRPLPSSGTPAEKESTVVIDTRNMKWSVQNKADLADIAVPKGGNVQEQENTDENVLSSESAVGDLRSNAASLRPSDSASRQVWHVSPQIQLQPNVNACSKYFIGPVGHDLSGKVAGDVPKTASPPNFAYEVSKIGPGNNSETVKKPTEGPFLEVSPRNLDNTVSAERTRDSTDHLPADSVLSSNSLERALVEYEADNQALFCRRRKLTSHFGQFVATHGDTKHEFALCTNFDGSFFPVGSVNEGEDCETEYLVKTDWRNPQVYHLHAQQGLLPLDTPGDEDECHKNSDDREAFVWTPGCDGDLQQIWPHKLDGYDYETNYFENFQEVPYTEATTDDVFQLPECGDAWLHHDTPATQCFSDASSDTDTDHTGMLDNTEVYQDRGLFLKLPPDSKNSFPAPRPFSAIRRAEADVVKALHDHWRPVKL